VVESDWSTDADDDSDSEPEIVDNDNDSDSEAKEKKLKTMTPEQMALATLMLSKKKKQIMIDDAYNRNAYNDDELPEWFADDEKKHRQANIPVTKDDMKIYREKMREIDARPIKKVAEAKARKKHKVCIFFACFLIILLCF
jgi:AdoMet-dependent rRNA methyltransferase SPB1